MLSTLIFCSSCSSPSAPAQSTPTTTTPPTTTVPAAPRVRVLVVTATTGFRHDSIPAAQSTFASIAARTGAFAVTSTENVAEISAERLAATDGLVFALPTGELPFSEAQKRAIVDFVMNGGGFLGFHSATDTLYEWPEYGPLVGAYFKEHPWPQRATVAVEDRAHPTTAGLGASF